MKYKPGMVFDDEDKVFIADSCNFIYVLCSKEPDEDWKAKKFQYYYNSEYEREILGADAEDHYLTEEEIGKLKYKGMIC